MAINNQATTVAESNFDLFFFLFLSGSGRRCLIGVLPEVLYLFPINKDKEKKIAFSRHCEISFQELLRMYKWALLFIVNFISEYKNGWNFQ